MKIFGKLIEKIRNKNSNVLEADGDVEKRKRKLKKKVKSTISVFLFCFLAVCGIYKNVTEVKATNFASKVVNIGGPITLEGNYTVTVWRSGNTVYCKTHVYVAAPNGAWSAMGAQVSTNKGSASNTFVGNGSATPKAGSGDVQFSFTDAGTGTVSGTIYAGFMPNLNGSQALTATFSVNYSSNTVNTHTVTYDTNGGYYKETYKNSDGRIIIPDGNYTLQHVWSKKNKNLNQYMTIKNGNMSSGTGMVITKNDPSSAQSQWTFERYKDTSYYYIINVKSGKAIGLNGYPQNGSLRDKAVEMYNQTLNEDDYLWYLREDGPGEYYIINKHTRQGLTARYTTVGDGNGVFQYGEGNDTSENTIYGDSTWYFNKVGEEVRTKAEWATFFTKSSVPIRPGYTFKYWSSSKDFATTWDGKNWDFNSTILDRAYVRAIGHNKYEVLAHTNGSIGEVSAPTWTMDGNQSDIVWYKLYPGTWERDGHTYNWGVQVTHKGEFAGTPLVTHFYSYYSNGSGQAAAREYGQVPRVFMSEGSYVFDQNGGNATLYANWVPKTVKTTFHRNFNSNDTTTVTHTYTAGAGQSFSTNGWSRQGYTLLGWSDSPNATTAKYTPTNGIGDDWIEAYSGSKDLYAVWKKNSYQQTVRVRFENADGSLGEYSQAYQANHDYGSTFNWEFPASKQYQSAKVSYTVTGAKSTDITVYRQKYALAITGDDGVDSISGTGSFRYGSTASVSYKVKTGYKFIKSTGTTSDGNQNGSWTGLAGKEGTIQDTWNITCNRNIKIYTELINYSISYNLNGGSMSGQKTSYNVNTATFTLPMPSKTGYTFTGWTGSNGTTPQTSVSINKGSIGNKSYTANWTINSYTLTVNPNGGSWNGSSSSQNIAQNYNTTKSIPIPTRTGYTFLRWDLKGSGTLNNRITSDPYFSNGMGGVSTYNNNGDGKVALTRQSKSSDNTFGGNYEIKIDVKGANNPGYGGFYHGITSKANTKYIHSFIAKLPKGATLAIAHNPVGDDYSKRWLTSNEGTGKWELYAYEMNTGSKGTFSTFGHIYVSSSSTSAFTWYLAASQITTVSSNATYTYGAGNGTLVAQWAPNRYTVTYNSNNGSGSMSPDTVTYNTAYKTKKNAFTRTGYTFTGWNEKVDGSGTAWSLASSGVYEANKTWTWTYTHDITLYAQWKANNYTYNIKYVSSSGKALGNDTVTGTFDTSKTVTPPAKTGYTTPAAQTVKFDSTSAKTITFTYQLINYTINYDINGGNALSGQRTSYNIESSTYTLPIPSRKGYKFIGWTGSNGNTPQKSVTIATGSTGDKSYKANWKSNSLTIRYHSNGAFGGNKYENGSWQNNVILDYEQSKDAIVFTYIAEEGTSNNDFKQYGLSNYDSKMNSHVYLYKNGYIGTGKYNTNPNGSGIEIDEDKTFNSVIELANYLGASINSKDNSIDLYPQWKAISYSIVYNSNGATSGSMTEQAAIFDKNVELAPNSFSRKYTVTYNAMGGTVNAPNNVATATFNGWEDRGSISFMDKNYNYNEFDAPYYSQGYTDLNAAFGFNKYNLIKHYFLYGKSEGRNPKDKTGKAGLYPNKATVKNLTTTNGYKVNLYANWKLGSVTLPTPTRFGYKFLGWYTSAEGGTKITGATYTPTSNVTLYAHWKLDSYYIDYKVNDTGLTDRITDNLSDNNGSLPGKDTAVMLTDFALQNGSKYNTKYTFKEWNTKPDGSGKSFTTSITNDGSLCKPGETLTLYAQWDTTPTITGKAFYMLENMKPASDILTSGKGLDKNPIDHFPDNMKDVVYPVKGYTKNGTDISSRIKVDYVEFDNSKTATASIDTKKPGKYTVHYSLTDCKQTKKFTRTITVLSASTPVINAGDRYFNKGSFVTAEMLLSTVTSGDRYDGDLTTKVAVLNMEHVAFNTVGSYDVQYKVTNRSGKTVVKKVKIHILEYLTDNQADKDNKYRYIRKDCSTKNDYCMEYFKENSKWVTNDELNNQIIDSLSKDKSEEAIKKYHFGQDDVQRAK